MTSIHPSVSDLSLDGSNAPGKEIGKACGAAVDSAGDVYVTSGGNSAVDVFGDEGDYLTAIGNPGRPCGVAVDSRGNLYVSESSTGNVVKYEPDAYPFRGTPSYSASTTIDSSDKAKGIAVDPFDDRLYVAEGTRVSAYKPDRTLGESEVQQVIVEASRGTFKLSFRSGETGPIPHNATPGKVEVALEGLGSIGAGNVSVEEQVDAAPRVRQYFVTFANTLRNTDVKSLTADSSGLEGPHKGTLVLERTKGFSGRIGEGVLHEATGVGAYVYAGSRKERYLFVADAATDKVYVFAGNGVKTLSLRGTIDGSETPAKSIGFGASDAYLGVDQADGHVYVYDAEHSVVDEFEADGRYVDRIRHPFEDARPTAIAIDRSGGPNDGTVYVTSGDAAGAEVLAFEPLGAASHPSLSDLFFDSHGACGTVVDSHGDIYVAGETTIKVYDPRGNELKEISDPAHPCELAVDSAGNLYASESGSDVVEGRGAKVVMYEPDSYPPTAFTEYDEPRTIVSYEGRRRRIAVDPANGHLYVNVEESKIAEYDSGKEGSGLIGGEIGSQLLSGIESFNGGLDVCGKNGDIYAAGRGEGGWRVYILSPRGTELLTVIDGSGSPKGTFVGHASNIAVDQSNCHVFINVYERAVEEYEASGAFVDEFGLKYPFLAVDIAVDNGASSPNRGNVYVAALNRLSAFGPLSYGGG